MLKLLPILASFGVCASACSSLPRTSTCPVQSVKRMPGVSHEAQRLEFWMQRLGEDANRVLLSPLDIHALNAGNGQRPWAFQDVTSDEVADRDRIAKELHERRVWVAERISSGRYLDHESRVMNEALAVASQARAIDEFRILTRRTDLRCLPSRHAMRSRTSSPTFDRNQCSGLAPGHLVRALLRSGRWTYVHAAHSVGWVVEPEWTPPMSREAARAFRDSTPRVVFTQRTSPENKAARARELGENYPLLHHADDDPQVPRYRQPTDIGLENRAVENARGVQKGWLPFTRANLLRLAFGELGREYGWGESGGGTDCSRLVFDIFKAFGIMLGRHSSEQARSGTSVIETAKVSGEAKRATIREASSRGVVLLYMPGHIMLYLGEDAGDHFALSSLSEYRRPCDGGGAETVRLDRVEVTTLELGRGTERTAFIERLTRAIVFGPG